MAVPGICRPLDRRDDPGDLPDIDPSLTQHHLSPGIATVGPAVETDPFPFKCREVADDAATLNEKAAMAKRDHREDRQTDEMLVAVRSVDHEPAERRLTASARRLIGDRHAHTMHIITEVNPLRDDLAGQQRREVIPGVASKLQREARHGQAPFHGEETRSTCQSIVTRSPGVVNALHTVMPCVLAPMIARPTSVDPLKDPRS